MTSPLEILKRLSDAADEINGDIDRQIYDEQASKQFESEPHDEHTVTLTWGKIHAMDRAICAAGKACDVIYEIAQAALQDQKDAEQ